MLEHMIARVPERWRELVELLVAPIVWIPHLQTIVANFFMESASPWTALAKYLLLLFPLLLVIAGLWCTQLSIYTLPFRSRRVSFVSTMLVMWWDAARAVWLYWVGLFRMGMVVAGWLFTLGSLLLKFGVEALRQLILMPFAMTGRMTSQYFQPGVPWVAFLMLVFWCMLETTIFTYTLYPTVSEVLADLVGADQLPSMTAPLLWFFLFLLIMGSFACVQAMVDAVQKRELRFIVQIVAVELFVMFFEVMFLYRELVDAISPWIALQSGDRIRMGIGITMSLATFGWVGIRGMTWFLFGRYGTPPLLAFISRQPLDEPAAGRPLPAREAPATAWWRGPLEDFKKEIDWLHEKSDELKDFMALPVLTLFAGALNFGMVLITGRPLFSLPFKGLKEVMETKDILSVLQLQPRKQGSV
ncbi:MAG TPA: hypothetical protein VFR64_16840 [Methylomirabilota bacterium]|nr:hypothetical protein [Methylomirabilota bacterium]